MRIRLLYMALAFGAVFTLNACGGDDFMPKYFGDYSVKAPEPPKDPNEGSPAPAQFCTVQFKAGLCVMLKGKQLSVGLDEKSPLCIDDLPTIPIQIQGGKAQLHGDEFPDLALSGHGLPAPITVNGKGSTDGKDNVGEGTVDAAGNITIQNFSLYVNAVGAIGKIPNLTFTTGESPAVGKLTAIQGAAASADSMTLVAGTILGSIIPEADKYFVGTALQIKFTGKISPKLSECSGNSGTAWPTSVQVTKVVVNEQKQQEEIIIPNGTQMEVASNIFIAEKTSDVGPKFEGSAKFLIRNIQKKPLTISIPPILGPFLIKAISGSLQSTLAPQKSFTILVTFRPNKDLKGVKPGRLVQTLTLGNDQLTLVGEAVTQTGQAHVHTSTTSGDVSAFALDTITFPAVNVPAFPRQAYFQCQMLTCQGVASPSACQPCLDVASGQCRLLSIDKDNHPITEVNANCGLKNPKAIEDSTLNILGSGPLQAKPVTQIATITNNGTKDMKITGLTVSGNEFHVSAVYLGNTPPQPGSKSAPAALPLVLPPYNPPVSGQRAYVVLSYSPMDLEGSQHDKATIGNSVIDTGILKVTTDAGTVNVRLRGATAIKEIPQLEVYFKTSTGPKMRGDGTDFALKGLTQKTANMATPVFVKLTDSANKSLRITSVALSGDDALQWLDTTEKINAIAAEERCRIPNATTDLKPVALAANGLNLHPQGHNLESMPLLGCINFHREASSKTKQRKFESVLTVTTVPLGANQQILKNPDGTPQASTVKIRLIAVVDPLSGKMVIRISQSIAALMIGSGPTIAAVPSKDAMDQLIKEGLAKEEDRFIFLGSMILDPFDEETIYNEDKSVATAPGDGITSIFRAIDTHPTTTNYGDDIFNDYTSLNYDATAPDGRKGVFFDYPNVPSNFKANSLRIFTSTLSFPGPLKSDKERPYQPSECQVIDPCKDEALLGTGPTDKTKKGVCSFFFASASSYDSPAMRFANDMNGGNRQDLCKLNNQPQQLQPIKGHYSLDGQLTFEEAALKFWGPTFIHNHNGVAGSVPPLDEVFHVAFTTSTLVPHNGEGMNLIPEQRLDFSKLEYKLNLTDTTLSSPAMCKSSTRNMRLGSIENLSTWKYLAPYISQDPEGKIPTGCPDSDNTYTGGTAYVHGHPIDPATGAFSVAVVTKFGTSEDLTWVFKNVPMIVILNGWLCDPNGDPKNFEGERCYDQTFNERDAIPQASVLPGSK